MAAIDIQGLVKRYGDTTAVDGLDLQVGAGQATARFFRWEGRPEEARRKPLSDA